MLHYNYDKKTFDFIDAKVSREHPLKPGEYILPAWATFIEPPEFKEGFYTRFIDGEWIQTEIPVEPEPTPDPVEPEPTPDPVEPEPTPEELLEKARSDKKIELLISSNKASLVPVIVEGVSFTGGWSSIQKLYMAMQFAIEQNLTERIVYDINNTPYTVPIEGDGLTLKNILLQVGNTFDNIDAIKRSFSRDIKEATTIEEIEAITFTF